MPKCAAQLQKECIMGSNADIFDNEGFAVLIASGIALGNGVYQFVELLKSKGMQNAPAPAKLAIAALSAAAAVLFYWREFSPELSPLRAAALYAVALLSSQGFFMAKNSHSYEAVPRNDEGAKGKNV